MNDITPDCFRYKKFPGKNNKNVSMDKKNSSTPIQKEVISTLSNNVEDKSLIKMERKAEFNPESFGGEMFSRISSQLEILKNNPQLVGTSEIIHEIAYKNLKANGQKDPYIKATNIQIEFINEFKDDNK